MFKLAEGTSVVIRQLLDETGHQLSVDDLPDLFRLNDSMLRLREPIDSDEWALIDAPVRAGNILLHQPTCSVLEWLETVAFRMFDNDETMRDMCVPYALAMVPRQDELWEMSGAREIKRAVKSWWRKCSASGQIIKRALEKLLPSGADSEKTPEPARYGPTISLLCREFGNTPEYWMTEAHVGLIRVLLNDFAARAIDNNDAARKAAQSAKIKAPPILGVQADAIMNQKSVVEELREKWQTT